MIVLYVPFPRNQAGDLAAGMDSWVKNHTQNFGQTIQVIFYQDEINYDAIPPDASIFLCAHGSSGAELKLYNNSNLDLSDDISIEEAARRLSHEFVFIHHKIQNIHLYCCGSQEKNSQMAKLIKDYLPHLQENHIHYYRGSLTSPNESGQLFSIVDAYYLPAEQVRFTVPPSKQQAQDEDDSTSCSKFHQYYLSKHFPYNDCFKAKRQEQKRHNFFAGIRERRQLDKFDNRRLWAEDMEIPANTLS
ncbi:hypothetical protein [Legionella erythra]|uniref:RNA binding protein (Contains ribosomal protein S1 domain) n=1 Tax=Legionella erythra TaxID=448 RepID=A0A0W0TG40_LEGER|nr:hypothetical protein [Legionella erythra]KTC94518.1 RNA binding protein (contains ribosomal protein S1 domain) [Legionella erythra]